MGAAAATDSVQEHLAAAAEISPLLKVTKLSDKAVLPSPAGYDLSSAADMVVPARGKALVPTDLSIAIPHGTYARIVPSSGLPPKPSIDVGAGVIHADYRGPVGVILFNRSDDDFAVKTGDRIAQIIIEVIDAAPRPVGGGDTGAAVAFDGEAKVTLYKSMPFRVLVDASDSRVFLLINSDNYDPSGRWRWLGLLSVGPRPMAGLEYTLEIRRAVEPGLVWDAKFDGGVPCRLCWTGTDDHPDFNVCGLGVHDDDWGSSDGLSVTVRVRKPV